LTRPPDLLCASLHDEEMRPMKPRAAVAFEAKKPLEIVALGHKGAGLVRKVEGGLACVKPGDPGASI
jgi:Zn-dependent alcohol dehydrogenase